MQQLKKNVIDDDVSNNTEQFFSSYFRVKPEIDDAGLRFQP